MPPTVADPVSALPGVGPKRAAALLGLGIASVGDLLRHIPARYEDRRTVVPVADLASHPEGAAVVVSGVVESVSVRRSGNNNRLHIATVEVADDSASASVVFFGGFRSFSNLKEGLRIALYGAPARKTVGRGEAFEFVGPEYVLFKEGARIPPEWLRLVPVYPTTAEVPRSWLSKLVYRALTAPGLEVPDDVPASVLKKRDLPSRSDAVRGVHAPASVLEAERSRRRLAYDELLEAQKKIRAAIRKRDGSQARPLAAGRGMLDAFVASLPFEPTEAQKKAIAEISSDLSATRPMRRLLHGDVGSGKTVVALAAVAQCVGAGCQAAVMVPTTVLSRQFFGECEKYLAPLGVKCAELRGGLSKRARAAMIDGARLGEIDVLVGTHALIGDGVAFKSLGLVVIDEQHRFGVGQREALASMGGAPHALAMSATPIPRTLCMALYGDIETTALREKPRSRKPVVTKILSDNHIGELYAFLEERARKGDRCFWICPLVGDDGDDASSVAARADDVEKNARRIKTGRLHGKMPPDEKLDAIARFDRGETNLLISTTVVEVGVDIPDAAVMVVEGASRFGLSTLHQLRGRIGRGSRSGVCILLDTARHLSGNKRLGIMLETDDGFEIAEEDLRIRGMGEIAGLRQHGWGAFKIADLARDADLLEYAREDAASLEP